MQIIQIKYKAALSTLSTIVDMTSNSIRENYDQ